MYPPTPVYENEGSGRRRSLLLRMSYRRPFQAADPLSSGSSRLKSRLAGKIARQDCLMPRTFFGKPLSGSLSGSWRGAAARFLAASWVPNPRQLANGRFGQRQSRNKTPLQCFSCRRNEKVRGIRQDCPPHAARQVRAPNQQTASPLCSSKPRSSTTARTAV